VSCKVGLKALSDKTVFAHFSIFATETNAWLVPVAGRFNVFLFLKNEVQHEEETVSDDNANDAIFFTKLHVDFT
jgi:hypothetical protein